MAKQSEVVALLQKLVRIPSVNPSGDPGTPHVGEKKLADFLAGYLRKMGAEVAVQRVVRGRPNVIARFKARKKTSSGVILESHTDTVSVLGMTIPPFGGEVRDQKVWGRGSCDTKGPMAAVLTAIKDCIRSGRMPQQTDVYFVAAMGEEAGNEGAIHLMESDFFKAKKRPVDFAIALEPTDMKIVHKHKGAIWVKISAKGRAVHGSTPERGDNAILKMRRALDLIAGELPAAFEQYADPDLGRPTFSVNMIRGGSKVNIVPDRCEIELDHRSLPAEPAGALSDWLKRNLPDFDVEVLSRRPGMATPADHPRIRTLVRALEEAGSPGPHLQAAPWFADSAIFAGAGIASVSFGPGSIKQAHTKDEFIEIRELELGARVLGNFIGGLP